MKGLLGELALQALRSQDRQLLNAAFELATLAHRRDWKVEGYVVVHEADCPAPEGVCDCRPIELLRRSR